MFVILYTLTKCESLLSCLFLFKIFIMFKIWILFSLIIFIVCLLFATCFKSCTDSNIFADKTLINTRLKGMVFETFKHLGPYECLYNCLVYTDCSSFNYHVKSGYCELNEEKDSLNTGILSLEDGFLHANKTDWPKWIAGECEHYQCPNSSRCVEHRGSKVYCDDTTRINVALHKDTTQSSQFTAPVGTAPAHVDCCLSSNAVDGKTSSSWLENTCSTTNYGNFDPWWRVKLGVHYFITGIEIINSHDTLVGKLHDIGIEVVIYRTSTVSCCRFVPGSLPEGLSKINCNTPIYGRNVRISFKKTEILSICEVRVFVISHYQAHSSGNPQGSCFKTYGSNVALNKPVISSSGGSMQGLVNGNRNAYSEVGAQCFLADRAHGGESWFQIDLEQVYRIESVVIYNQASLQFGNNGSLTVSTGVSYHSFTVCTVYIGVFGLTSRILDCDIPKNGQYVRISTYDYVLYLCEVEVTTL